MPDEPKKFYLTTPIYYVNARPHIGHAYSTIVADVLARRHRLLGDDTYFLTGTDEHGQKIERAAAAAGIPPQQYADQVSKTFSDLWARMGITHDQFIRTTEPRHKRGVQKLFRELYNNGQIYLDSYTGAYCVSDEAFVDAPVGTPCPDCGKLLEQVTEENFFFRLSAFQQPLIDLIESNALLITPDSARNEVLSFIRGTLKDVSVSRSSFTWGVPVPDDLQQAAAATQKHVIYVWFDALVNYMTALGYGSDDDALWQKFWPADIHLVGKEITRFHCVYWPAFLLAAGLPVPKQVTANGWLLFDNSKMSKSKGNVVRTETILDAFGTLCPPAADQGVAAGFSPREPGNEKGGALALEAPSSHDRDLFAADILRYYLLREIPFGQDGSFSFDSLITRYNADLANGYGNLVSRTLSMIGKYFVGEIPSSSLLAEGSDNKEVKWTNTESALLRARIVDGLSDFAPELGERGLTTWIAGLIHMISSVDFYLTEQAPWRNPAGLDSELQSDRRNLVLYTAAESIRIITAFIYPILPYATSRVWAQLGLGDIEAAAREGKLKDLQWGGLQPGTKLGPLSPIFPRADKGLAQIMTDMENTSTIQNLSSRPESAHSADAVERPAEDAARPAAPLKSATTPAPVAPVPTDSTHPAAGPRTGALDEPSGTLPVAGSTATTTNDGPTPPHTEAQASGIFAKQPPAEAAAQITIDDFIKVELRVAQIVLAERIPKADKLLRLEVDLGEFGRRQILSGIAEWYTPEDLVNRKIVVITNLAPRKMRGLDSHGMLLAASEEGGKPILATFGENIPNGTRLK